MYATISIQHRREYEGLVHGLYSPQEYETPQTVRADIINMGLLCKCLLGTPQCTGDKSSPLHGEDYFDEQKEVEQKICDS